jgi:hypothetical protein
LETIYALGLVKTDLPVTVSEMLDRMEALSRRVGELEEQLRERN